MPPKSWEVVRFEIEGVMSCRSCGTVGYAGERYCSRCGTSFSPESARPVPVRSCPDCHEPLHHPIAFYCPYCGTALDDENA